MKALAYLRTSSNTNVQGDSADRQRDTIQRWASAHDCDVVGEFYDAGVPGSVMILDRPAFKALLDRIDGNGIRTVIIEDTSRLAREMLVFETGLLMLLSRGITVIEASSGDVLTDTTDPMRVAMRQIVAAVVQAEKRRLVLKLKGARERATARRGYRKADQAEARYPGLVERVMAMRAAGQTMQAITDTLAAEGLTTATGKPFALTQIARLIKAGTRT